MPLGAALLVVAVLVLAAFLVAHVALFVRVQGVTGITRRQRLYALVPLFTPWLAWRAGLRKHVVLWAVLALLYAGLRAALR